MALEVGALIVSIVAAMIAVVSFFHAIVLRQRTKRESEAQLREGKEQLSFITNLVVNSAADPGIVRRMLKYYDKEEKWPVQVSKRPDGKLSLDFTESVSVSIGVG